MKKSIVVNLFAGPGADKSTGATYIFSKLKMLGIDAEYVSEFAKDKVWEENERVFQIFGNEERYNDAIDYILERIKETQLR